MISEPQFELIYSPYKILQAGDVLQEKDIYWSTENKWLPVPCPGCVIQAGVTTIFVRPYFEGTYVR